MTVSSGSNSEGDVVCQLRPANNPTDDSRDLFLRTKPILLNQASSVSDDSESDPPSDDGLEFVFEVTIEWVIAVVTLSMFKSELR